MTSSNVAVFKTQTDTEAPVYISGVGMMGAEGKGGLVVEDAAKVMSELQEKDDRGALLEDEDGYAIPLTGKALDEAAKDYADTMNFRVVNIKEEKVADLKVEAGALPDGPSALETSLEYGAEEQAAIKASEETGEPQLAAEPNVPDAPPTTPTTTETGE